MKYLLLVVVVIGCVSEPARIEEELAVPSWVLLADSVQHYLVIDAPLVAIKGVKIIDGTGGEIKENQTLLIEQGRIQAVGSDGSVSIPRDVEVLELPGRTIIPGIIDQGAKELDSYTDVRELQKTLKEKGVAFATEADESTTGPASFVVVDPDGNPILVDQHVGG